jgi:hypothetical protein
LMPLCGLHHSWIGFSPCRFCYYIW